MFYIIINDHLFIDFQTGSKFINPALEIVLLQITVSFSSKAKHCNVWALLIYYEEGSPGL